MFNAHQGQSASIKKLNCFEIFTRRPDGAAYKISIPLLPVRLPLRGSPPIGLNAGKESVLKKRCRLKNPALPLFILQGNEARDPIRDSQNLQKPFDTHRACFRSFSND
ncbi:hypothetical protein A8C56_16990 [Niabella ginsenosidivorans]|uniref:Uncharacterized protein n=1 Tax=Niabella ginsenosidivorans TaxID=1176587 RepID=A0A1A9I432_9BACT|nr:hypothetical protein A8C56_16990 [Niabella ginsenosidivorans]